MSSAKEILTFSINGVDGVIDGVTHKILVRVPYLTNVTSLAPQFIISGVMSMPMSGEVQDFTNPVSYTITAADQSVLIYEVTVVVAIGITQRVDAAAGGTVRLMNGAAAGATVIIPPNALLDDTDITIAEGADIDAGMGALVGPSVAFGPSGLTFLKPVQLGVPHVDTGNTNEVTVLHRHDDDGSVESLFVVDSRNGMAYTTPSSFSSFQAMRIGAPLAVYSSSEFQEARANNGTVATSVNVKLLNTSFVSGPVSISCTNAPLGLVFSFEKVAPDFGVVSVMGASNAHRAQDSLTNLACAFVTSSGSPFQNVAASGVLQASRNDLRVTFKDPYTFTASAPSFLGGREGDGSVATTVTINVVGDTFAAPPGTVLPATYGPGTPRIVNLPSGLTPEVTVLSRQAAQVKLLGNATMHSPTDMPDMNILFSGDELSAGSAAWGTDTGLQHVGITWVSAPRIRHARWVFVEDPMVNDGSIATTSTITLENDAFAGTVGMPIGTVMNVPAGLSANLVMASSTTATLSFSGMAAAHSQANDVFNLTVAFGDSDFVGGPAGPVYDAVRDDLAIDFKDGPGFVYTGLPGGGVAELMAFDFGAGAFKLYWQPMLLEDGLAETFSQAGTMITLLNMGLDDAIIFKSRGGGNIHDAFTHQCGGGGYQSCGAGNWSPNINSHPTLPTGGAPNIPRVCDYDNQLWRQVDAYNGQPLTGLSEDIVSLQWDDINGTTNLTITASIICDSRVEAGRTVDHCWPANVPDGNASSNVQILGLPLCWGKPGLQQLVFRN